jgi:hypothetical protein
MLKTHFLNRNNQTYLVPSSMTKKNVMIVT